MTRTLIMAFIFLLVGLPASSLAQAGEPADERLLSNQVKTIDWVRFKKLPYRNQHQELSAQILRNSAIWGSEWVEQAYKLSEQGDRYLIPNLNREQVIRPGCSVAVGLAVAIKTGIVKEDPEAFKVTEEELTVRTARLIKGLVAIHKANGGEWGDHWQSSLWAALLGRAAWMLWESVDDETREMVCNVVVFEADRFIREGYRVPYWNGKGGDSKAEENSWEAMILQQAIAMLPDHQNVIRWKRVCSELQISAYARISDMEKTQPVLDGRSPKEWLGGYNLREDGIVINHGLVHNDYMSSIAHLQMQGFLVSSLADTPVSETTDFNFDVIYRTMVTKHFNSPPYKAPGGTMYIPGKAEQYYPQGTDWSTLRFTCFLGLDTFADVLEYDKGLPHKASHWRKLRAEKILEMQSRHADGRMYAQGEFDSYPGREQMVLWMLGDSYLLQWLADRKAIAKKGNWLSDAAVQQAPVGDVLTAAPAQGR